MEMFLGTRLAKARMQDACRSVGVGCLGCIHTVICLHGRMPQPAVYSFSVSVHVRPCVQKAWSTKCHSMCMSRPGVQHHVAASAQVCFGS
jgi:hypothetical protein